MAIPDVLRDHGLSKTAGAKKLRSTKQVSAALGFGAFAFGLGALLSKGCDVGSAFSRDVRQAGTERNEGKLPIERRRRIQGN